MGRCRHDDAGHGAPPGCQWHTVAERQRLCCPATHGPHRPRMIAARSSRRLQQETRGLRLVAVRLQGRCDGLAHEVRGLGVAALPFGPRVLVEVCPGDSQELILRSAAAPAANGAEGAARAGGPGSARGGGGGGGWGVQKPWLKNNSSKPMAGTVPKEFEIDEGKRHTGTVSGYWKLNGYGFIEMDTKGAVPNDKVFVYWTGIQSSDRFPQLTKGMQVEFSLTKETKNGSTTVSAKNVTMPGGADINLQDEADGKKKFVGGQNIRYTGKLKFFIPKRGYGYIQIDDGYQYPIEGVPKEIRVETAEVNAGGKQPTYLKDVEVEFGIWQTQKGVFKAYNMTGPGGVAMPTSTTAPP
mmetsp:Transcript_102983/g.320318  ORF Transcript_102983/g.320318 Transcript_102983/m.320318 type:complete len:354 (-) Transcript_102983:68-1129(-)